MVTEERAKRCTIHHYACDCREWAVDALLQQAEEALPDPDKLKMLANWLDLDDVRLRREASMEPMVQDDLRLWASRAHAVLRALRKHQKGR